MWGFYLIIAIVLVPARAWAFGPVTHFELAWGVVEFLREIPGVLSIPMAGVLTEYLLGNVVPDIVLAKNLAKFPRHSHNWENGFSLLESALNDRERAVALGYLSHLAADVVAHNLYVPAVCLNRYFVRGHGHVYWEVKMDQLMLQHKNDYMYLFQKGIFHRYDYFLDRIITGTIVRGRMNNRLSRRVFSIAGNLATTKKTKHSLKPELQPPMDLVNMARTLAFRSIVSVMRDMKASPVTRLDPRGRLNAKNTKSILREIRKQLPKHSGPVPEFDQRTTALVQELIQGVSQVIPDL